MSDMMSNNTPNNMPANMPNVGKLDIMKIQQILQAVKTAAPFGLIEQFKAWEQSAQDNREHVLWSPKFREQIVSAFSGDPDISAMVEKLYLQILQDLYDAQESIRDKIRKTVSNLLDEASSKLGL